MSTTVEALDRLRRFNTWFSPSSERRTASAPQVRGVRVTGYLSDESGWGAAGRGYVRALQRIDVPMRVHDVSSLTTNRSGDRTLTAVTTAHDTDVNLVCVDAGQHFALLSTVGESFFAGHYNIGAWAWELPRFPDTWFNRFAYYDEIWVGTSFIAAALAPISPVPVVRVPPAVAVPSGSRARGRARIRAGDRDAVFLFTFDVHSHLARKNPHAAIAAFRRAFPNDRHVRLVLKSVNAAADVDGFAALMAAGDDPRIAFHDGYWTNDEMHDLVAACDAYVSLHRSEGTGLTIAEAMAAGKPVLATDWSGNTDFADASNSYPVAYRLTTIERTVGPYHAGETWAEPDVEHAAALMREVVEHPGPASRRGALARLRMQRDYSEDAVARIVRSRLDVIGSRGMLPTLRGEVSAFVSGYRDLVGDVRAVADRLIPRGEVVAVVSRGDPDLVALAHHRGRHFPESPPGVYAGYHPADSGAAIAALEEARGRGAGYLIVPGTAFWWFEHYVGFRHHLDERCDCLWRDATCIVYALEPGERPS